MKLFRARASSNFIFLAQKVNNYNTVNHTCDGSRSQGLEEKRW